MNVVLCLGGDGVILHTQKVLRDYRSNFKMPPIISINFGTLGFMSQYGKNELISSLSDYFQEKENDPIGKAIRLPSVSLQLQKEGKNYNLVIVKEVKSIWIMV